MESSYGKTALGGRILGTKESLTPMTGATLQAYHDKWYVPNNVSFLAVGEVDHDQLVADLNDLWSDIPAREIKEIPEWKYIGGELNTSKPEKEMSLVAVCFKSLAERHDKAMHYDIIASILGQGKASKLHKEIVDNQQLTSSVHSENYFMKNAGIFMITSSCKHDKISEVKAAIFEVLNTMDISAEDLNSAVLRIKTDKKSEMLSPAEAFVNVGYSYTNTGEIETLDNLNAHLDSITLADIQDIFNELKVSEPSISVVGKV